MNLDQFRYWMAKNIAREGGQRRFAEKYKVDKSVVSLVLGGHREPSAEMADALGFTKEPEFKPKKRDAK